MVEKTVGKKDGNSGIVWMERCSGTIECNSRDDKEDLGEMRIHSRACEAESSIQGGRLALGDACESRRQGRKE